MRDALLSAKADSLTQQKERGGNTVREEKGAKTGGKRDT